MLTALPSPSVKIITSCRVRGWRRPIHRDCHVACSFVTMGMVILVGGPGGKTNAQGHCYDVFKTYLTEKNQSKCCSHLPRALFTPKYVREASETVRQAAFISKSRV